MRTLALVALLVVCLVGCTRIETSACGAFVSPEQCNKAKTLFASWVSQSCSAGTVNQDVIHKLKASNPGLIPVAHATCQSSANGNSTDNLFYMLHASNVCNKIEQGGLDRGPVSEFIGRTIAVGSKLENLTAEMKEELRSQCNEFANGRISSRDLLYNEARLWRQYQREGTSALLHSLWDGLIWPIKAFIGLLGVIATVLGVIGGFKKLSEKPN